MIDVPKASQRATADDHPLAQPARAFLFADLHGSTALYERIGDAAGYEIVRRYFAFVAGIVGDNDGVVVKTIGDAAMATFANSPDAVKAALALQARIATFDRAHSEADADRFAMKLGIHCGDSVRVRLGNRFDYFGFAVNMAARLQGLSLNGDVVLSRTVAEHPGVRPLLAAVPTLEQRLHLRGVEGVVRVVRVLSAAGHQTWCRPSNPTPMRSAARAPPTSLALGGY